MKTLLIHSKLHVAHEVSYCGNASMEMMAAYSERHISTN